MQGVAATVQAIIAVLMLWTLIQNRQTLKITTRQLEASIAPVVTPSMSGSKACLVNDGSIEIKQIAVIAVIGGWFDINTRKISEYHVSRGLQVIQNSLAPGKSLDIDVNKYLLNMPTDSPKVIGTGMPVYGLVITFRRAADMKPFIKLLPFSAGKDTKTQTTNIIMPLFPSPGSAEAGPGDTNYSRVMEEARAELIAYYRDKVAPVEVE